MDFPERRDNFETVGRLARGSRRRLSSGNVEPPCPTCGCEHEEPALRRQIEMHVRTIDEFCEALGADREDLLQITPAEMVAR